MSFARNRTPELWQSFMPIRHSIEHVSRPELFSVEVYRDSDFFQNFDPTKEFEKWAAMAVSDSDEIPEAMDSLVIPEGLYAVFNYRGKASEAQSFYQQIYVSWLPQSGYELDNRPHLAIMGEKYKHEHPDSEEEIWIPVIPASH